MATTNNERVGQALALLAQGLAPFVDRECGLKYGMDWENAVPGDGARSKTDIQFLLRTMTSTWRDVFERTLGRMERNYVSELIDARNRWAHQESFSSDDAYRALDSAERLLLAINAGEQAAEVGRMKHDLQRRRYTEEARRVTRRKGAEPLEGMPSGNLRPWREVVMPHPDVATGQYQQAEFAADLHQVWRDEAEDEYGKPEEFFRRTFLTEGLRDLLLNASRRLRGEGGDPVVQLQTNFGGGKTHSLIALYHLAGGLRAGEAPGRRADARRGRARRAARGEAGRPRRADDRSRQGAREGRRHGRADALGRVAPPHAHVGPHLRLPPRARGRRDVPHGRLRVVQPAGDGPRRVLRRVGCAALAVPTGRGVELRRVDRRARARRRGRVGHDARSVPRDADLRAAGHDRDRVLGARSRARPARRAVRAVAGDARRPSASTSSATPRRSSRPRSWAAAVSSAPRRTTTGSPRCCSTEASSTACACSARRTVDYMARNHLPGGQDLEAFGRPLFAETTFTGMGFGLGFSVVEDHVANKVLSSVGEFACGRRGEHGVLGRPGRGDHRAVHDPAAAVEHLADPPPAQAARLPSAGRLTRSGGMHRRQIRAIDAASSS